MQVIGIAIQRGFSACILETVKIRQSKINSRCTEVRFASFFSGGFTTMIVINPPERKLAKRTSVHWFKNLNILVDFFPKHLSKQACLLVSSEDW